MSDRVVILGGGLAGIAAAISLVDAGCPVTLIETKKRLGGRATSFVDPRTGAVLDNCQHVVLGCCTNLLDLYQRLDVLDQIQWHRTLYWTDGKQKADRDGTDRFEANWLPAPLHLGKSLRRMKIFDRAQKRQIQRGMLRMLRLGIRRRGDWEGKTFRLFLDEAGQSPEIIDRFWNPIVVSACNLDVDRVGATHALQVFQEGFLGNRFSYVMGLSQVPLVELYGTVESYLNKNGGEIQLGVSAKAINFDGRRVTGVVTANELIEAKTVISTLPFDRLDKIISEPLRSADARLQDLGQFEVSPILGVHLVFDRQVMSLPHLVFAGGDVHWIFNKGTDKDGQQHIHAVISGAEQWMTLDEEAIVNRVLGAIGDALPDIKDASLLVHRSVKEKRATFAATADVNAYRPGPGAPALGGVSNLLIAGDWSSTGWPATMEGATRSGYAAASLAGGCIEERPDISISWMARLLGLR